MRNILDKKIASFWGGGGLIKKGLLEIRKKAFRPKIASVSPQRNKRKKGRLH